MKNYSHISTDIKGSSASIIFNRPQLKNAMHIEMIREIKTALYDLGTIASLRTINFKGNGTDFSAGADLNWMKNGIDQSEEELLNESRELAELFQAVSSSPKITIAQVHGRSIGGSNGIVAACDIALAGISSVFRFSEVRLGLIPATIAPYVVKKVGTATAKEWMLSGRSIKAEEAYLRGLANWLTESRELEAKAVELNEMIASGGPEALMAIKTLLDKTDHSLKPEHHMESSARLIASHRISAEGQEGIKAFFEKRDPSWKNEKY